MSGWCNVHRLNESTRNLDFKKHFPNRFIQVGVQEQFLAAGAAGSFSR